MTASIYLCQIFSHMCPSQNKHVFIFGNLSWSFSDRGYKLWETQRISTSALALRCNISHSSISKQQKSVWWCPRQWGPLLLLESGWVVWPLLSSLPRWCKQRDARQTSCLWPTVLSLTRKTCRLDSKFCLSVYVCECGEGKTKKHPIIMSNASNSVSDDPSSSSSSSSSLLLCSTV